MYFVVKIALLIFSTVGDYPTRDEAHGDNSDVDFSDDDGPQSELAHLLTDEQRTGITHACMNLPIFCVSTPCYWN